MYLLYIVCNNSQKTYNNLIGHVVGFFYQYVSQTLWFLIPALELLTDDGDGGEEVSHEQNKEAEATHQDLAFTWDTENKT